MSDEVLTLTHGKLERCLRQALNKFDPIYTYEAMKKDHAYATYVARAVKIIESIEPKNRNRAKLEEVIRSTFDSYVLAPKTVTAIVACLFES